MSEDKPKKVNLTENINEKDVSLGPKDTFEVIKFLGDFKAS